MMMVLKRFVGLGIVLGALRVAGSPPAPPSAAPAVVALGRMAKPRAAHQATRLTDGRVLITGGCPDRGCPRFTSSAELYDPVTGAFQAAAPMRVPRASHTATLLPDGRVLVAGGCTDGHATASTEIYDPAANRWSDGPDMPQARCSQVAVRLLDGRVFLMGGGSGRLGDAASALIYDPDASRFTEVPLPSNHYLATRLADGRVLLTGGQDADGRILARADIFDPATSEVHATGSMRTPRVKHGAARLADGRVLVVGGSDRRGFAERFASTEIYDPATGRFSPGPPMLAPRHKLRDAVVALPSGAVLVAGGAPTPEVYDPRDNVFVSAAGEIGGLQMFATATLLGDGNVLVLGGYDERTQPSAAAWLLRTGG